MKTMHQLQRATGVVKARKRYVVIGVLILGVFAVQAMLSPGVGSDYRNRVSSRALLSEEQLIGDRVVDMRGEALGVVNDVVVDTVDGRLTFALVSPQGFTGQGDEVIPVPWSAMGRNGHDGEFVLNITRQDLQRSPRFFKDKRPDLDDPCWDEEYQHFYPGDPQHQQNDRNIYDLPEGPPVARR